MESKPRFDQFTLRGMFLLVTFLSVWLAITVLLGTYSLFFWCLAVFMAIVLGPAHQRRSIPESATDVLAVAVVWSVAWGVVGFVLDKATAGKLAPVFLPWTVLGQLMGCYLGMIWVLIQLVYRHLDRAMRPVGRPRSHVRR